MADDNQTLPTAGTKDLGGDISESHDPDSTDAVVVAAEVDPVREGVLADGPTNLNLELTMNVQHRLEFPGESRTEESRLPADDLLALALRILERIDARTASLEGRMSSIERPLLQAGVTLTQLQSLMPKEVGSEVASGSFSATTAATVPAVGCTVANPGQPPVVKYTDAGDTSFGYGTQPERALDKGKGVILGNNISSLDIIIPNSPGYDDDIIIDEALSTPHPKPSQTRQGSLKGPIGQYWCSGVPKRIAITGTMTNDSATVAADKVFMDLPSLSQFECTNKVCEVFSVPKNCNNSIKKPKLENVESKPSNGAQQSLLGRPTGVVITTDSNAQTPSLRGGSGFRPYGMTNIMASPVLLIPMGFQMVFRPTVHMDLTLDECKIATYIYGKQEQHLEVLFKFSSLEVPRLGFHSLSPMYMPNVDIMNIIFMSASMKACSVVPPRYWYTPSVFADDVILMRPLDVILKKYVNRWMPATPRLELVFVPICEPTYTWYMMVVDVKHGRVICLDVTRAPEHKERRERNMRIILLMLAQIFKLDVNCKSFSHVSTDPTTWGPVQYPEGVQYQPDCNDSCLWILHWIQTEGKFKVRKLPSQMDPLKLRMKTATKIVLLDCNEVKASVASNADVAWGQLVRKTD